jgi:DNA-binding protein HU-beta
VNKSQFIDALAERYNGSRREAAGALDNVIDTIVRSVQKGEAVAITGFGKFDRRIRPAGTARNPRTGATVKTKKKAVPKFTPGAEFKAVVSGAKKLPAVKKAAPAKKTTAKKTTARKTTAKKTAAKKTTARKTSARKTTARKTTARKTTARKTTARKAPAKKTTAKKTAARKTTARKAPAKKTTARKSTARKR